MQGFVYQPFAVIKPFHISLSILVSRLAKLNMNYSSFRYTVASPIDATHCEHCVFSQAESIQSGKYKPPPPLPGVPAGVQNSKGFGRRFIAHGLPVPGLYRPHIFSIWTRRHPCLALLTLLAHPFSPASPVSHVTHVLPHHTHLLHTSSRASDLHSMPIPCGQSFPVSIIYYQSGRITPCFRPPIRFLCVLRAK